MNVPGDSVKREKSVLVPRLLQNVGDVRVAKRVQGRPRASHRRHRSESVLCRLGVGPEVEPPQTRTQAQAEQGDDHERAVDGEV